MRIQCAEKIVEPGDFLRPIECVVPDSLCMRHSSERKSQYVRHVKKEFGRRHPAISKTRAGKLRRRIAKRTAGTIRDGCNDVTENAGGIGRKLRDCHSN